MELCSAFVAASAAFIGFRNAAEVAFMEKAAKNEEKKKKG